MKKFAIIGLGPVGGILGAHLIQNGNDVVLIDILPQRLQEMKKKGITISDPRKQIKGDFTVFPDKMESSIKNLKEQPGVLFICVKSYSLHHVISDIKDIFSPSMKLVFCQNGLDIEKLYADSFPDNSVFRVSANYGGIMTSEHTIKVTFFNKPNYLGISMQENMHLGQEIVGIMNDTGLETVCTLEIKKHEWEKAILNSCLAPISAVTGLTMKEVMDAPDTRDIVVNLLREGIAAGESVGIQLPDDFFNSAMNYLSNAGYHKPSMLVDIENKRRTEIDFLNQKICEYGVKNNIPVSYNKMITALVKGCELKIMDRGAEKKT